MRWRNLKKQYERKKMQQSINNLIILTYPFIVVTALLTAIAIGVMLTIIRKSDYPLFWFMIGVILVALTLSAENVLFLYGRYYGNNAYNAVSGSMSLYALKLLYGFGMWVHLAAALATMNKALSAKRIIIIGFTVWLFSYIIIAVLVTS